MKRTTAQFSSGGLYVDRDISAGTPGTILENSDRNTIQEELVNVATLDGSDLNANNDKQIKEAIFDNFKNIHAKATSFIDATTPSFSTTNINDVAFGNDLFVAVGASGKIAYSSDGDVWTQAGTPSFSSSSINGVTFGNDLFVAVGASGKIAYSSDGDVWTQAGSTGTALELESVSFGSNIFITGGLNVGQQLRSQDADTWTSITTPGLDRNNSSFFGNGIYFFGGSTGANSALSYSDDGDVFTNPLYFDFSVNNVFGITYGNGRFVIVGQTGEIAYNGIRI